MSAEWITRHGFVEDADAKAYFQGLSDSIGLSDTQTPHTVDAVYTKGDTTLLLESNVSREDFGGGITALMSYPQVAVLDGPGGRLSFDPADIGLLDDLLSQVQ